MKKSLLLASAALLCAGSAFAKTDGQAYEKKSGLTCESLWAVDLKHDAEAFNATPLKGNANARTSTVLNGIIYVADSSNDDPSYADDKGALTPLGILHKFNLETGKYEGKLQLKLEDGTRLQGTLCANQVGADSEGNLWVAGASFSMASGFKAYSVNTETGVCTLQADIIKEADFRSDFADVLGDITRKNGKCAIIAAGNGNAYVNSWSCEKGATEWKGNFEGEVGDWEFTSYSPSSAKNWGITPICKFVPGEGEDKYDGRLFYVDGHGTTPALYDRTATLQEGANFTGVDASLVPANGANGIVEFSLGGSNFIAYASSIWTAEPSYVLNVCKVGDDFSFGAMEKYWTVPADGLGTEKSGIFIQGIDRQYVTDNAGKNAIILVTFECKNGLAVYRIAEEGFGGVEGTTVADAATINVAGGMITVSAEASEIAVFNAQGQLMSKVNNASQVAAPAASGAYIVKAIVAGSPVVKKVIL